MRKTYVLILVNLIFINLRSQTFNWAHAEGLYAYDYGMGIATDVSGNVYIAGKYEEFANFSGTILPCAGNHDIYLAQYSASGALNWIRTAGGSLGDYAHALACDGTSSLYIAGEVEGTGGIISFPGSSITLSTMADNDIFVAKYDLNGTPLWARSAGGFGGEKAHGVTYDNSGNVFVCGNYKANITFDGSTTLTHSGLEDGFIAKYDSNGNFLWAKKVSGPGTEETKAIVCDAAGNSYICGTYSNGAVFGSTTMNTTGVLGYLDAYIAKYAPDGTLVWVKTAGGDYDDVAWSLTKDSAGKIYATGEFNAYALFDGIPLTTTGSAEIFVACYNDAGTIQWAKSAGGALIDRSRGIGSDGTNLYITGQFGGIATFGTNTVTAADSSDVFMAKLDNSGNFLWAMSVGGTADTYEPLGFESGTAITAEASGNVYATGGLLNSGTFGAASLTVYDRTDVFITKITQGPASVGLLALDKTIIYPNPGNGNFTVDLTPLSGEKVNIIVYNSLAQIIEKRTDLSPSEVNFDLSAQEKGMYFIEIQTSIATVRNKIIFQ